MKVVVINGAPTVGKDTFVTMCADVYGGKRILNISTVDYVKDIAYELGWDGTKTPKNRKFLSDLKDLLTEWEDIPFIQTCQRIESWLDFACEEMGIDEEEAVVFIHCREPDEIARFVEYYDAVALCIRRSEVENQEQSNHAGAKVFDYVYDYTIYNDSTLSWLRNEALVFLRDYLKLNV